MSDDRLLPSRRQALKCLAYGSAGTLFALSGGVLTPIDLASAADTTRAAALGTPLLVQISDTHIGFDKEANPDVNATLRQSIELVNALPQAPALALHTGDITHMARAAEFDVAQQLLAALRVGELHAVPGEHDVPNSDTREYLQRFGKPSANRGYYSFDHSGVHFIALVNVLGFKPGAPGALGAEQLAWVSADLKDRTDSTPIVVFAHMPLWTVYAPWGWDTGDAAALIAQLRRFGSVTILNGHIHQIVQKLDGHITFHTARSTAYPQPAPGSAPNPGPLTVPVDDLPRVLGVTTLTQRSTRSLSLADTALM